MSAIPSPPSDPADQYLSTSQAAKRLGLSLGTVQQMVEDGVLKAWKTTGGHRRILQTSLEAYLAQRDEAPPRETNEREKSEAVYILIAEDDTILQKLYQATFATWGLPLKVAVVNDGIEGLIAVARSVPDVLIADLGLPGVDGFQMIRTLRGDPTLASMDIIVISGMDTAAIATQGGLPSDVTVYGKPVPFPELRGYIQAKARQKRKELGL
jgi:excisionase family DNA binding protein